MKRYRCVAVSLLVLVMNTAVASAGKVLVDPVGHDTLAPKQAVVLASPGSSPAQFRLVHADTGGLAWQGELSPAGKVARRVDDGYAVADFSGLNVPDADGQRPSQRAISVFRLLCVYQRTGCHYPWHHHRVDR